MEQQNLLSDITDMPFSPRLKEDLRTAAIWARLSAIFSFVTTAFSCLQNIVNGSLFSAFIMAAVSITIGIYLFNFGNKTKKGIDHIDQPELEEGLNSLRVYFKTLVIIIIIVVSLLLLAFLFGGFSSTINYR